MTVWVIVRHLASSHVLIYLADRCMISSTLGQVLATPVCVHNGTAHFTPLFVRCAMSASAEQRLQLLYVP